VSFGPKQRAIGEAAKTLETSNYKNTIGSLKRLVGRTLNDPDVSETEKQFINAQLVDIDGSVGVKVSERKICRPIVQDHFLTFMGVFCLKRLITSANRHNSLQASLSQCISGN
jgi:molecular chaperone DnaK (HSP70)